jgi:hypothetical protein
LFYSAISLGQQAAIIAAMNYSPRLWGEQLVVFLKPTGAKIDDAAAISKH